MTDLKNLVMELTAGLGVKVIKKNPHLTRLTLDRLLQSNPEAFARIVPQCIDKQSFMQNNIFKKFCFLENYLT